MESREAHYNYNVQVPNYLKESYWGVKTSTICTKTGFP